jgi:hypothetical protein
MQDVYRGQLRVHPTEHRRRREATEPQWRYSARVEQLGGNVLDMLGQRPVEAHCGGYDDRVVAAAAKFTNMVYGDADGATEGPIRGH